MKKKEVVELMRTAAPLGVEKTRSEVSHVWGERKVVYAYETLVAFNVIYALVDTGRVGRGTDITVDHEVQYAESWKHGKADIALSHGGDCGATDTKRVVIEVKWVPKTLRGVGPLVSDLRKLCWAHASGRFVLCVGDASTALPYTVEELEAEVIAKARDPNYLAGWRSKTDKRAAKAAAHVYTKKSSDIRVHAVDHRSLLVEAVFKRGPLTE